MSHEETFGPVAAIARFATEDGGGRARQRHALRALRLLLLDATSARIWRVGEALEYGIVGVNTGLISTEVAPFGGVKESGIGREGSSYGVDDWVELKYWAVGGLGDRRLRGRVILEQRDYHVYTGQAARARPALRGRGHRDPAGGARRVRRRVHGRTSGALSTYTLFWRYDEPRRARDAAGGAAGARRLEGVPRARSSR